MKIVVAGLFQYSNYEEDFSSALTDLGHEVHKLPLHSYFNSLLGKLEFHFHLNLYFISKLNKELVKYVDEIKPDLLLIWRGSYILPRTIKAINKYTPGTTVVSYNNDDPFSPLYTNSKNFHQRYLWKYFIKTIPLYHANFVFRPINIEEYNRAGSKRTYLLQPYFNGKDVNGLSIPVSFKCDVVFIGHPEPHRINTLNFLIENNVDVKIYGVWDMTLLSPKYKYGETLTIRGRQYYEEINNAKVCLCFYSKLNRDQYTIRSFEVPGAMGLILSERTGEMLEMFAENKEALYFDNNEECLQQVNRIINNIPLRNEIAMKGNKKVYALNAEVKERAKDFLVNCFSFL